MSVWVPGLLCIGLFYGFLYFRQAKQTGQKIQIPAFHAFFDLTWVAGGLILSQHANPPIPIDLFIISYGVAKAFFGFGVSSLNTASPSFIDWAKSKLLSLALLLILVLGGTSLITINSTPSPIITFFICWAGWVLFDTVHFLGRPFFRRKRAGKLTQLDQSDLTDQLQEVFIKAGLRPFALYQQAGPQLNAGVEGIGPFKRVVFQQGVLDHLSALEIKAVLAHELGHIAHHHVLKYHAFKIILSLGAGLSLFWITQDVALTVICAPLLGLMGQPVLNGLKRFFEVQADDFAHLMTSVSDLISALDKIHQKNRSVEKNDPLYHFIFYGHPSYQQRFAHLSKREV